MKKAITDKPSWWLNRLYYTGAFFVGITIALSCRNGDQADNTPTRQIVLTTLAEDVILPSFEEFGSQSDALEKLTWEFFTRPDTGALRQLRNQWLASTLAWKKASVFSFGPVNDQFIAGSIDYSGVHYPNIEDRIQTGTTIDTSYIKSIGSSLKGLKAIEYLLFKYRDADSTVAEFRKSEKRRDYLLALTLNLNSQAQKVVTAWTGGTEPYKKQFEQAYQNEVNSSINLLVNQCLQAVSQIRDEQLGMSLGLRDGSPVNPQFLEGNLSQTSLALIKAKLEGIKVCFTGNRRSGLHKLLDQTGAKYEGMLLSQAINNQFDRIDQAIREIDPPLTTALFRQTENVKLLHQELKNLQILISSDVVNQLGLVLTFSDNDGD